MGLSDQAEFFKNSFLADFPLIKAALDSYLESLTQNSFETLTDAIARQIIHEAKQAEVLFEGIEGYIFAYEDRHGAIFPLDGKPLTSKDFLIALYKRVCLKQRQIFFEESEEEVKRISDTVFDVPKFPILDEEDQDK